MREDGQVTKTSGCLSWLSQINLLPGRHVKGKPSPITSSSAWSDDDDDACNAVTSSTRLHDRRHASVSNQATPTSDVIETFDFFYTAPSKSSGGVRGVNNGASSSRRSGGGSGSKPPPPPVPSSFPYGDDDDQPVWTTSSLRQWNSGVRDASPASPAVGSLLDAVPPTPGLLTRRYRRAATLPASMSRSMCSGATDATWELMEDAQDVETEERHYKEPVTAASRGLQTYSWPPRCSCLGCADHAAAAAARSRPTTASTDHQRRGGNTSPYRYPPSQRQEPHDEYYNSMDGCREGGGRRRSAQTGSSRCNDWNGLPYQTATGSGGGAGNSLSLPAVAQKQKSRPRNRQLENGCDMSVGAYDMAPPPLPVSSDAWRRRTTTTVIDDQAYNIPRRLTDDDDVIYDNQEAVRQWRRDGCRGANFNQGLFGDHHLRERRLVPTPCDGPLMRMVQLRQVPFVSKPTGRRRGSDVEEHRIPRRTLPTAADYLLQSLDEESEALGMFAERKRKDLADKEDRLRQKKTRENDCIYINGFVVTADGEVGCLDQVEKRRTEQAEDVWNAVNVDEVPPAPIDDWHGSVVDEQKKYQAVGIVAAVDLSSVETLKNKETSEDNNSSRSSSSSICGGSGSDYCNANSGSCPYPICSASVDGLPSGNDEVDVDVASTADAADPDNVDQTERRRADQKQSDVAGSATLKNVLEETPAVGKEDGPYADSDAIKDDVTAIHQIIKLTSGCASTITTAETVINTPAVAMGTRASSQASPPHLLNDAYLLMMSPPPQSDPARRAVYTDPCHPSCFRSAAQLPPPRRSMPKLGTGFRLYDFHCVARPPMTSPPPELESATTSSTKMAAAAGDAWRRPGCRGTAGRAGLAGRKVMSALDNGNGAVGADLLQPFEPIFEGVAQTRPRSANYVTNDDIENGYVCSDVI